MFSSSLIPVASIVNYVKHVKIDFLKIVNFLQNIIPGMIAAYKIESYPSYRKKKHAKRCNILTS